MSDDRLLSDYLLGECSAEDARLLEHRLATDPRLRERARLLSAVSDRLSGLAPAVWEAITDESSETVVAPRRRWVPRPAAGLAAAVAAVVLFAAGIGVGALLRGAHGRPPGTQLALRPLTGESLRASGTAYVTAAGRLELVLKHLPETASGHYYEAWLMTNLTRLVSLASFRVAANGEARVQLQLPALADRYRYIDVSLQRSGGGTAHSQISVLRGPTSPS